jgi:alpha-glucosidase
VINVKKEEKNSKWEPLYGERKEYPEHYNEALVQLSFKNWPGKLALRIRAYNEGVAFRYEINSDETFDIDSELTEFAYPGNPLVWTSYAAQSPIEKQKLSDLSYVAERPLLAELSDSVFTAVGEAALVDFARMKFEKHPTKPHTLVASLDKGEDNKSPITVAAHGYPTPWRYIMAGETPGQILQHNYLLLNLNEANNITHTSFIKPGKAIREVTLTTQGGMACVDFAVKHNLQYVEFDAGWYGNEYDNASDATTVTVDPKRSPGPLDLQSVVHYAKEKGVGVILYVNQRALGKQLDEVLPLVKSWGVAGVKYGFVNVGPQQWTTWLHDAVRKAAKYDLMVDIHDEYRPTGYSRTFPNLMTQEGIRGDEESTPNDGVINTIFTRMIAGAGDHTNCYFADRVQEKMGSHASQMAKTICIYSPWQFLYWYDRPVGSPTKKGGAGGNDKVIAEMEELRFFDDIPTVWDDTKVIEGYPGKYVAIARKKGDQWYLGALAGTEPYPLALKLDFLDQNKKYKATIFSDDSSLNTQTHVKIQEMEANHQTVLEQHILEQNGLAVRLSPIE